MDRQFGAQPSAEKCAEAALDRLSSVGLNDLHTWLRPLACLSNGQRERAAVAMRMQSGLAIDDVGATVDERNATVLAAGIARLVRRQKLERVVLTSSKAEVVRWTGAAWAYFPATRTLVVNAAPGAKPQVRLTLDDDETDEQFMRNLPPSPPPPGPQPTSSVVHSSKLWGHGKQVVLESVVADDAATEAASSAFEIAFNGKHRFEVPRLPALPKSWRVALVNGVSGSGKSSVLRQMVQEHGCVRDAPALRQRRQPRHLEAAACCRASTSAAARASPTRPPPSAIGCPRAPSRRSPRATSTATRSAARTPRRGGRARRRSTRTISSSRAATTTRCTSCRGWRRWPSARGA